jgi:hypothetical protein
VKACERKPSVEALFGRPRGPAPGVKLDLADVIEVLFLTARRQVRDAASYGRTPPAAGRAPGATTEPGGGVKSRGP